ncbi:MAG: NAD(P)H-hydrate epimerase, partial [Chloroflexi bacterium]|nr:NAD(P)H-hydrate epimerase [Chloroflexota bacterium]
GLDAGHLMERAGQELADVFRKVAAKKSAVVVCGKGNNGGDGFVAARLLRETDYHVSVFHATPVESFSGDARRAFERLPEDIPTLPFERAEDLGRQLVECGGVIDALFGFGLEG